MRKGGKREEIDAQIADMHRRGLSVRDIALRLNEAGHKVGKSTIANRVKAAKATPGDTLPPVAQRGTPKSTPALGVEDILEGADLSALDFEDLEDLCEEIATFRRDARDNKDVRTYKDLAKLQMEARVALNKVRPPPRKDPNEDPDNIEAKRILIARVEALAARFA